MSLHASPRVWLIVGYRNDVDTGIVIEQWASEPEAYQRLTHLAAHLTGYWAMQGERFGEAPVDRLQERVDLIAYDEVHL